jgi:hypothetical protein
MKSKGRTISYTKEIAYYSISLHVTYMVPTLEQRHKRVLYERIAISYIFIFMTDFK